MNGWVKVTPTSVISCKKQTIGKKMCNPTESLCFGRNDGRIYMQQTEIRQKFQPMKYNASSST